MANIGSLAIKMSLDSKEFESGIGKVDAGLGKLPQHTGVAAGGIGKLGGSLGAVAVKFAAAATAAVSFAAAVRGTIASGAEFEKSMSRVKALSGATGADFSRLEAESRKLGATTEFTASQAASAMQNFATAGFSTNEILKATGPTLALASAGQIELGEAADITARVMRGMGIEAGKLGDVADVLTQGFAKSNMTLSDLGEAFKFVGPIARAGGKDFREVTATLGALADAGIRGEMGGTTLRGMMMKLSDQSDAAKGVMEEFNISFEDVFGNFKSFADIADHLRERLSGLSKVERLEKLSTLFEARTATGMAALIEAGGDTIRAKLAEVNDATGRAAEIQETQLDNVAGSWDMFKSAIEGLSLTMFDAIKGPLKGFLDWAGSAVGWLDRTVQKVGSLGKAISEAGAGGLAKDAGKAVLSLLLPGVSMETSVGKRFRELEAEKAAARAFESRRTELGMGTGSLDFAKVTGLREAIGKADADLRAEIGRAIEGGPIDVRQLELAVKSVAGPAEALREHLAQAGDVTLPGLDPTKLTGALETAARARADIVRQIVASGGDQSRIDAEKLQTAAASLTSAQSVLSGQVESAVAAHTEQLFGITDGLDSITGKLRENAVTIRKGLGKVDVGSLAKDLAETSKAFDNLQKRSEAIGAVGLPGIDAGRLQELNEQAQSLRSELAEAGKLAGRIGEGPTVERLSQIADRLDRVRHGLQSASVAGIKALETPQVPRMTAAEKQLIQTLKDFNENIGRQIADAALNPIEQKLQELRAKGVGGIDLIDARNKLLTEQTFREARAEIERLKSDTENINFSLGTSASSKTMSRLLVERGQVADRLKTELKTAEAFNKQARQHLRGKEIADQFKPAIERFRETSKELFDLGKGHSPILNIEPFTEALKAAALDFHDAAGVLADAPGPQALLQGSAEAISAINAAQRQGDRSNPMARTERILEEARRLIEESRNGVLDTARATDKIVELLRNPPDRLP